MRLLLLWSAALGGCHLVLPLPPGSDGGPQTDAVATDGQLTDLLDPTKCGNGSPDPGEQCDTPQVGCTKCRIDPGYLCENGVCHEATGIAMGPLTSLDLIGGSGGSPVEAPCPVDSLLTGLEAESVSSLLYPFQYVQDLSRLRGHCYAVSMGSGGELQWAASSKTDAAGDPSTGDVWPETLPPADCPQDTYVVAMRAQVDIASYIQGIELACRSMAVLGGKLVMRSATYVDMLGGKSSISTTSFVNCPAGQVAGGFRAHAGTVVDAFTLTCGAPQAK